MSKLDRAMCLEQCPFRDPKGICNLRRVVDDTAISSGQNAALREFLRIADLSDEEQLRLCEQRQTDPARSPLRRGNRKHRN